MGIVIQTILMSPRVTRQLKNELLAVALSTLRGLESHEHLAPLASVMREHLIKLHGFQLQSKYLDVLKQCFDEQDHILRANLRDFSQALDAAREIAAKN